MAPSHTISAHLCKQIYNSFRQTRQSNQQNSTTAPTQAVFVPGTSTARTSTSPERRSIDSTGSGRASSPNPPSSTAMSRQSSASSWFGGSNK